MLKPDFLRNRFAIFAVLSVKILFSRANFCGLRFADVAQICNLLYRRIAFGSASRPATACGVAAASGLQIRDTAEFNSALLRLRLRRVAPFCGHDLK